MPPILRPANRNDRGVLVEEMVLAFPVKGTLGIVEPGRGRQEMKARAMPIVGKRFAATLADEGSRGKRGGCGRDELPSCDIDRGSG